MLRSDVAEPGRLNLHLAGVILATSLLAGCGAIPGPSSGCVLAACPMTPPAVGETPSAASAAAHGWTTTAAISAGQVEVRVSVTGPLTVEGGCVPALTAWVVGADGRRVDSTPTPGVRCQGISIDSIAVDQSRDYHATIPLPLPGTYTVHGLVRVHLPIGAGARVSENIPVVTLTIT